jgi:hypothetical protein
MYTTETQIKFNGKVFTVPFPNVGQQLQIESTKMLLSNNTYHELSKSTHDAAVHLLDVIDGISYFYTRVQIND